MKTIKTIFLLLLTLSAFSCEKDNNAPDCNGIREGDSVKVPGLPRIRIAEVENHLCPCLATCIWGGYVGFTLMDGTDTLITHRQIPDSINYSGYSGYVLEDGKVVEVRWHTEVECPDDATGEDYCMAITRG